MSSRTQNPQPTVGVGKEHLWLNTRELNRTLTGPKAYSGPAKESITLQSPTTGSLRQGLKEINYLQREDIKDTHATIWISGSIRRKERQISYP